MSEMKKQEARESEKTEDDVQTAGVDTEGSAQNNPTPQRPRVSMTTADDVYGLYGGKVYFFVAIIFAVAVAIIDGRYLGGALSTPILLLALAGVAALWFYRKTR